MFRRLTNERDNIYMYITKGEKTKHQYNLKNQYVTEKNKPTGYLLLHVSYQDLKRFVQIND